MAIEENKSCAFGEDCVLIGLRWLFRKLEELLALTVSVPEEQAQELRVKATCGARDGRHKGDTMVISVGVLILEHFLLGGLPQRRDEVPLHPICSGTNWVAGPLW